MRVSDIFHHNKTFSNKEINQIRLSCSQFLRETNNHPLLKQISISNNVAKVKVRFHKKQNEFIEAFNSAFYEKHHIRNLHQRAIFASSNLTLEHSPSAVYIFPKNGYKFLYSPEVTNTNNEYQIIFEQLFEQIDNIETVSQMTKDLLKYTYTDKGIHEGMINGAEIILYDIPSYYAVKTHSVQSYNELLSILR